MHRNVIRSLPFALGLAVLAAGLAGCGSRPTSLTFKDAQGDIRRISDHQSGVLVLGFLNTWCESCQEAAYTLQDLHQHFADAGVRFVLVSSWERGDPVEFMERYGLTYGLMLNGTEMARDYNVDKLPTFCVLGPDGKLLARFEGYDSGTAKKLGRSVEKFHRRNRNLMSQPVAHTEE